MVEHRVVLDWSHADRRVLDRLHRQFGQSLEEMAGHIEAADLALGKPHDTRFHLQEAMTAMVAVRMTLQQIAQHCGAMEAQLSAK
jgi:hypothetical protein